MKMKPTSLILKVVYIVSILLVVSCQPVSENTLNTTSPTLTDHQTSSNQIVDETIKEDDHGDSISEKIPHGLEFEFWHPWAGETAEMVEELVDNFNRENPWSITINSISHADQDVLIEDLTEAFIKKEQIPDLIVSNSQSLKAWYVEGYPIKELNPFIRFDSESSAEKTIPEILPIFWNVDVVDEERIGIPAYQSGQFLFYNQSWGKELGLLKHFQNKHVQPQ
jgi:multiple sugar transport system substrate-binding protein